jgi:hypothetical protein
LRRQVSALASLLVAVLFACRLDASDINASPPDWPVYRHDAALSGVTPAEGNIDRPEVHGEYYLGTPYQKLVTTSYDPPSGVADLDGDGTPEHYAISDRTIRVSDSDGRELWSHTVDDRPLGTIVRVCRLFPDRKDLQIVSLPTSTATAKTMCWPSATTNNCGSLATHDRLRFPIDSSVDN